MTDIERDTERRITTLETNVNNLITELRDFKTEMRQQNQMRAEELRELRQRQDAAQDRHNAEMKEMREDIKGALRHIQGLTIASMVATGAIAIATWAFVLTNAYNDLPPRPAHSTQAEVKPDVADK